MKLQAAACSKEDEITQWMRSEPYLYGMSSHNHKIWVWGLVVWIGGQERVSTSFSSKCRASQKNQPGCPPYKQAGKIKACALIGRSEPVTPGNPNIQTRIWSAHAGTPIRSHLHHFQANRRELCHQIPVVLCPVSSTSGSGAQAQ